MPDIKIFISDCTECPKFNSERYYTSDSFEVVFEHTCTLIGKRIGYADACEKQPSVPNWCPLLVKN